MNNIKAFISIIAIILTLLGYIPYVRDTIKGKTLPHVYTWFIWGLVAAIAFALQVSGEAGAGSWVTLTVTIIAFFILMVGFRKGRKEITFFDTLFFILSLFALFLWLVAKQPVLSVILVSLTSMLGFTPTIRKSWSKPHSETLFTYELNAVRHGLSILALEKYSIVTWLYPATWTLLNFLFSLMLIARRKQMGK